MKFKFDAKTGTLKQGMNLYKPFNVSPRVITGFSYGDIYSYSIGLNGVICVHFWEGKTYFSFLIDGLTVDTNTFGASVIFDDLIEFPKRKSKYEDLFFGILLLAFVVLAVWFMVWLTKHGYMFH